MAELSVVVITLNKEKDLPKALASVKKIANEIIVVDMKSTDKTVSIAEAAGARVYQHKIVTHVEPARNYAISKATKEWVLVLDPDEEIGKKLAERILKIVEKGEVDYVRLPRKNIVFGKWMKHSRWWPDYNIRLFKKGHVEWGDEIHSIPVTKGNGTDLQVKESFAIKHNSYQSLDQYLRRMNRYTSVQADELIKTGNKFIWKDLILKPTSEFLSRYFSGQGYKDGLHGLALSILQAFSEAMVYLKVWEKEKFLEQATSFSEVSTTLGQSGSEFDWWMTEEFIKQSGKIKSLPKKIARKIKHGKRT